MRQAFLVIEDTVLKEFRNRNLDMAAQAPFTASDERVYDSRKHLEDLVYQEVKQQEAIVEKLRDSAKALNASADSFDVG